MRLPHETEAEISPVFLLADVARNGVSTLTYAAPAVPLVIHEDVSFLITGFMWSTGILVYVTNNKSMLPFYFFVDFVPAALVLTLAVGMAYWTHGERAALWTVLVMAGALIVYLTNTLETLADNRARRRELEEARQAAQLRLEQLEYLNTHDPLTDLLNRTAFDDCLETALTRDTRVAVMLCDLDGFKPINDTYGHAAGDQVLIAVARRLKAATAGRGHTARLGGDEFAVILHSWEDEETLISIADQASAAIKQAIPFRDRELGVGVSIGLSYGSADTATATQILAEADQAMYRAKSDSNHAPVIYRAQLFAPPISAADRSIYMSALRSGGIVPHYQPKVDLATREILGFEALARWIDPEGNRQMPHDFIPKFIELGLQGEFAYRVTRAVLGDLQTLVDEGLDPGKIAINMPETTLATLSGRDDIQWLLAEYEAVRHRVILEVTEDVFTSRSGEMIQNTIAHFSESGVRISLDDFGTGYASFQHLRKLRFDELKIDESFVSGLGKDPVADVILEGFLSIAKGLDVAVVAEGVETELQAQVLLDKGCRAAQGYLFGAAEDLDSVRARLRAPPVKGRDVG